MVVVLVVLVLGVGVFRPGFLDADNLLSTGRNAAYVGLMAAGMVFPLAMREVDLSVGGNFALSMVVGAVLMRDGMPPWLAVPVILLMATALGALNGVITTYARIPSFIVTLATALLFRGIALAFAAGKQIFEVPRDNSFFVDLGGRYLGVPVTLPLLVVLGAVLTLVFTRTRFGAQVRAIGSNPDAAAYTGLPVDRIRIQALAVSGLMAGVAGTLALAFFMSGDPTLGEGFELTAIAAAIIGGTALGGGRGSVPGAIIGALILALVTSALVFFRIPINWTSFATGAVILVAVAADAALRRYRTRTI
ncbi:ABC transporter permease [Amorphoplanes digitatis]|uniref:Autoinducer 2 import system permease protein LsrC n=1 Tax=Actinoplanes digitatis TaxID=1868 RepID=A0A7W7MR16_9ACTN|nr:ABC transporter permease [Actinoplanes digitatis]MBB4763791.1 ribose transport system permease protein [Actinoplanes digitatis]GID95729.1 monosaccharide-transporting ATPase [Actinoplanes digitatis]